MPVFHAASGPLHFLDVGVGLPVLLLHPFALSGEAFAPQVAALGGKYRFLVPDLRGFGRSPPAPGAGPLEMSVYAAEAFALMDHLGLSSAVLGGVSMGGYVAMAALREDAGRVRALILADTQALPDDDEGKVRREAQALSLLQDGTGVLVETLLPRLLAPAAPMELQRSIEATLRATSPEGAAAALRGMAVRLDSRDMLARFNGPSLVLGGAEDVLTPPAVMASLAGLLQGSRQVALPGAGHLANLEAPDAFNAALDAFLQGLADTA